MATRPRTPAARSTPSTADALLEAAIDTLSDGHREVFVLREIEGMSTAETAEAAMRFAERAHVALGCRGATRTDFRYDDTDGRNRLIVLETNTQPGMTPTSLVPEQAAYKGMSFRALVRWILEDASCDR